MILPAIWRNYYDLVGYHRDRRTQALWLKPIPLDEMNHQMINALYLATEGDGTISCKDKTAAVETYTAAIHLVP